MRFDLVDCSFPSLSDFFFCTKLFCNRGLQPVCLFGGRWHGNECNPCAFTVDNQQLNQLKGHLDVNTHRYIWPTYRWCSTINKAESVCYCTNNNTLLMDMPLWLANNNIKLFLLHHMFKPYIIKHLLGEITVQASYKNFLFNIQS